MLQMKNLIRQNTALWTVQTLLAALYLFAGPFKVLASPEALGPPGPLPIWFLRLIGVFETLGALGLILPGLTGIKRALTPIAATCLIVIMIGATIATLMTMSVAAAIVPFVVGLLDAVVAVGRREWLLPRAAVTARAQPAVRR